MSSKSNKYVVLANGAKGPKNIDNPIILNYQKGTEHNVNIGLPRFVQDVFHIPARTLDLLEIASYVYAADRDISRGEKEAVEYQSWSRSIVYYIRVRDYNFWNQEKIREALQDVLLFMTGDAEMTFYFESGHSTPPTNLFDSDGIGLATDDTEFYVTLFSGGIDSLCGAIDLLENTQGKIVLVSHQSRSGIIKTQRNLIEALEQKYRNRILHYKFECTFRGHRAVEETQRTRSFLYASIAYAIATIYGKKCISIYENGVTSINLRRREDLANARASRTTHPQTIGKLSLLFSLIGEDDFQIHHPYLLLTKAEVIEKLKTYSVNILSSSVSCSRTFHTTGEATHCGCCFQCIDRRIAAHAVEAEKYDHHGLYIHDIIIKKIPDRETRTILIDYIRQAKSFEESSIDKFESEYLSELGELIDYFPFGKSDSEKVEKI